MTVRKEMSIVRAMRIGVSKSRVDDERRVALVPEIVSKLVAAGHQLTIEADAGTRAGHLDSAYVGAGASIGDPLQSEVVVCLDLPDKTPKAGTVILGLFAPFQNKKDMEKLAKAGLTVFAFEAMPRTTRAQVVDVLSSQATIAGYQAVLEGATLSGRLFPMLTTAAGTIPPARVLILGAGVAGLQAIATARRLGAMVSAFDVRAAAAEQVLSLGAKFVSVDLETQDASTSGGYAKEVGKDDQQKILDGLAPAVIDSDVIICTAAIPGKQAPLLIEGKTVSQMRPGSVIVDLSASTGGNCELTQKGKTIEKHNVKIVGETDLVSRTAFDASRMYSRNVQSFLALIAGKDGGLELNWDDDIVAGSCIARDGKLVHPLLTQEA